MKERKPSGNSILRVVFVALSFLLQIVWLLMDICIYAPFVIASNKIKDEEAEE